MVRNSAGAGWRKQSRAGLYTEVYFQPVATFPPHHQHSALLHLHDTHLITLAASVTVMVPPLAFLFIWCHASYLHRGVCEDAGPGKRCGGNPDPFHCSLSERGSPLSCPTPETQHLKTHASHSRLLKTATFSKWFTFDWCEQQTVTTQRERTGTYVLLLAVLAGGRHEQKQTNKNSGWKRTITRVIERTGNVFQPQRFSKRILKWCSAFAGSNKVCTEQSADSSVFSFRAAGV